MVQKIIENYVKNMKISDVDVFAKNNNISLSEEELTIIYEVIKKYWYLLIYDDSKPIFEGLKEKLNPNTYKKAEELFFYFKTKYQKFL